VQIKIQTYFSTVCR